MIETQLIATRTNPILETPNLGKPSSLQANSRVKTHNQPHSHVGLRDTWKIRRRPSTTIDPPK
jgi:hypothetical protein